MSTDSAVSIAWDVLKWVVIPIKRQFGYVMSSKRYARDLQKEVGKLESEDERIQNAMRVAGDNLRHVYSHVSEWQRSAEKVLKESGDLLGDFEKASKTCCYGTLPDPNFRYQFSRKAKDKIKVIQDLATKGCQFNELNISSRAPAPGIVTAPTRARREGKEVVQWTTATASASSASTSIRDDGVFKSRAQMIRDIIDALADNSNRVVGVYGMGGVGKSTLLVDTERRIREEKSFDLVAKADVSENPDVKRIQGEIAHSLGLDIKNEEYINVRAERLHTRLEKEEREKKKVLIILDNLWERLDLDKVGIPCGPGNKARGCKLLLTARDQRVLRREMLCDSAFLLGGLENVEAKRLFEKTVGGKVTVELEPLVEEALRISAGLPFLIVAISKLFIDTSYSECDYALKQIWSEDTGKVITKRLQLSYGRISEEAKSLLRLCVAYGVSKPYPDYLARYGFGLRIFQGVSSVQEARVRLGSLIHTLQASSLLLDGEEDAGGFKIHDLVREFVASFASTNRPLLILKDKDKWETTLSEERLKICEAICFPYVDLEELPKELICPELRIFLLLENERSLEISDSYFNSMKNLMALDLSGIRLGRSPSPFQFMENLHTLCVDDCSVEDVSVLGKLKGLQILSLQHSDIQQLPKQIGQLTKLRLLDLDYCSKLQIIEPGVLGRLTKLEELYMKNSFDQWSAGEQTPATNAGLIELNNMKNLRTLHVSIRNPSALPRDLDVEKLTKYKIRIGDARRWRDYEGSRMLELNLDGTSDVLRKECIQSILAKADDLFLYKLDRTEKSISALSSKGFPKLKHLHVGHSPSFRYILEWSSLPTFEALETLLLDNLVNLEKICTKNISIGSFSTLKVVRVEDCNKMEVLFPCSMMRELPQLEEIEVARCKLMRGIVEADDDRGKFELPKLRELKLDELPNIENFITTGSSPSRSTSDYQIGTQIAFFNGQQVAFPSLETLDITGMDNIKMIWDNQAAADSFPKLKSLCVDGCNKLKCVWDKELHHQVKFQCLHSISVSSCKSLTSLFPASIVRDLTQLEEPEIRECGIAELIEKEEGVRVPGFDFPKLTSLQLEHLTKLKCLYTGTHTSHWPALKTLRVDGCNKVDILASQIENEMPRHKQPLFLIEKGTFPNLQEFKLDLCERMEIWHGDFDDEELFCKLRVLELCHLSKESATSTSRFVESLTNLEELVIRESYLEQPSSNVEAMEGPSQEQKVILPFSRQIKHLKALNVSDCDGLSSMFTPTIAENLVALTKLRISNCRILTEVISDKGSKEGHEAAFHHLKYMELDGLIELKCFSSGGCALIFPLLEDVIVNVCPNMKFFSEGPIEAPKLDRVKVGMMKWYGPIEYQYFWKENLNMTIQNIFKEMATVAKAKFVRLFEFPELVGKWHNEYNPVNSSWQLETLVVDKCPSFINAMPSKLMLVLEKMTILQVYDCEYLEEIFDLQGLEAVESTRVLPRLVHLNFFNLPKLRQLWNKDLQGTMRFNSLSSLTLYKCSNLRHAFTPSMAWCLANLVDVEIRACDHMEGVIEDEEGQGSAVEKITFPNLSTIKLKWLPNLTSFLSGKNHALECPKLEYPRIAHCPKMRSLTWQSSMDIDHNTPSLFTPRVQFLGLKWMVLSHMDNLSKIWPDNPQETLTFDSLLEVKVKNCESLENLFPYWVGTSLTQLGKLRVESCRIEEIVTNGDDTRHSNVAQVLFPKLTSLVLHDMTRLKTFCPNLPTLNWQFLKELRVTHRDKPNMLSFAASMSKWTQRDDQQDLSNQEAHSSFERDFPNLNRLLLVAKDIRMIRNGKFPDDIFGKPKALTLACFHDEKATFPPSFLLERFQNMKSLEIFRSSFEDIFPGGGIVDEGKRPVLESLRKLKLSKLHKLKRVWREDCSVSKILPSIKTLEVRDCPELTVLFPAVTSFGNLTKLVVKNSSGLVHLGTASTIASLVHLENMTIVGCERMKEVVADDENEKGQVISFRKLKKLTLQNMPSLECFSTTSCILGFPLSFRIEVEECPKMKIFSKGTLSIPKYYNGTQFGYDWECSREWEGDLNRAIQKLSS
ncbi:uncharacterized protein LOC115726483 [Rhodamnia argentea]|uniref:Uncharacterized protein LOC115726483 n=1 Tax=Rhodamnia argentea TaxID=178133 RepID=A0ABM3HGL8_9MYRT|nr:uncharacterized protein LOC115726483 [Rhodamnia argentea]